MNSHELKCDFFCLSNNIGFSYKQDFGRFFFFKYLGFVVILTGGK